MYKIYLKQAWALLRENRLLTAVSIFGTALAICLVMVIVIVWQVRTAGYSPEDNRGRTLYISLVVANNIENPEINNCSLLGSRVVKECFYPSKLAEAVGMANHNYQTLLSLPDHTKEFKVDICYTDAGFWRVFDFRFLAGKPYDEAAVASGLREAVISESAARRLFGTTDVVGRTVELGYLSCTVRGVVADVSILASDAYGDVWAPYTTNNIVWDNNSERLLGAYSCYVLARSAADLPRLKEELLANVERMNASQREYRLKLNGAPDTVLERLAREDVMAEPKTAEAISRYVLIGALILLIPAINMSGITLSRMRKRMAELGVRRAFGATRSELVGQILCENLLQTFLGGLLGSLLSYGAVTALSGWLLPAEAAGVSGVFLSADMLFNPLIFLLAVAICLLLNLLSAGIPAWRGARVPIVEALNEH